MQGRLARAALQTVVRSEWQGEGGLSAEWLQGELSQVDPSSHVPLPQVALALTSSSALLAHAAYHDSDMKDLEAHLLQLASSSPASLWADEGARLAALKFWRTQRPLVRELLLTRSAWNNGLTRIAWRVDSKVRSRATPEGEPVPAALMELGLVPRRTPHPEESILRFELDRAQVAALMQAVGAIEGALEAAARH